eukprot:TRINITY_DN36492_c0_g2_i2.p1 TRINITY_DN36492_c0_g2~~TRINITY_DN36492_c0_g2_i2.p1  ORF type:complete len:754 (-),score=195.77 TRINITY_DN36492_c0_g2_i2:189-2450(-)
MGDNILRFQPLSSFVDISFWKKFRKQKFDIWKLDTKPRTIKAYYGTSSHISISSRLMLDESAFGEAEPDSTHDFLCSTSGVVIPLNTGDELRGVDKKALLYEQGQALWARIRSGEIFNSQEELEHLTKFSALVYLNGKTNTFMYWFAFPSIFPENPFSFARKPRLLKSVVSPSSIQTIYESTKLKDHSSSDSTQCTPFFICLSDKDNNGELVYYTLADFWKFYKDYNGEMEHLAKLVYFGFVDTCPLPSNPSCILRNYLMLILYHFHELSKVQVLSFRPSMTNYNHEKDKSVIFDVDLHISANYQYTAPSTMSAIPRTVGWENDKNGKVRPRVINLNSFMSSEAIMDQAVDLNIKLMKWRMMPELQENTLRNLNCLLLGAGTLGCQVARNLVGWGVRNITLVDNGKVAFSNPSRQCLFHYDDCLNGGTFKAEAAAAELKRIFPSVNARGEVLTIPMAGHSVPLKDKPATEETINVLKELISSHDVIFLLTDSRESRWLPTVLCTHYRKLTINCALGFDSYVVMRHGHVPLEVDAECVLHTDKIQAEVTDYFPVPPFTEPDTSNYNQEVHNMEDMSLEDKSGENNTLKKKKKNYMSKTVQPDRLGCYFCNDFSAPNRPQAELTMDQQCTVTRIGLTGISAAYAVELMVSVLHHPEGWEASADSKSCVGNVPHQMRGTLRSFQNHIITGVAFDKCIGCSPLIQDALKTSGMDFLFRAFDDPSCLETLVGIDRLKATIDDDLIAEMELSDDEFFDE